MTGRRNRRTFFMTLGFLAFAVGVLYWLRYREMQRAKASVALIAAVKRHDTPAALAALDAGADPNASEDEHAASFSQILRDVWNRLRRQKPATRQKVTTILLASHPYLLQKKNHLGLEPSDIRLITALVEHGADCNVIGKNGMTPLMFAARADSDEVVRVLLEHGADVNARDNAGFTALTHAVDIGAVDDVGQVKIVKTLVEHGAKVNSVDNSGETALLWAIAYEEVENVKFLLDAGANVNIGNNYGVTALIIAAIGPVEEVKAILKHGANVNARDSYGRTALLWAVTGEKVENVKVLLDAGADIHIKGNWGQTVIDYVGKGNTQILALLKQAKAKEAAHSGHKGARK